MIMEIFRDGEMVARVSSLQYWWIAARNVHIDRLSVATKKEVKNIHENPVTALLHMASYTSVVYIGLKFLHWRISLNPKRVSYIPWIAMSVRSSRATSFEGPASPPHCSARPAFWVKWSTVRSWECKTPPREETAEDKVANWRGCLSGKQPVT